MIWAWKLLYQQRNHYQTNKRICTYIFCGKSLLQPDLIQNQGHEDDFVCTKINVCKQERFCSKTHTYVEKRYCSQLLHLVIKSLCLPVLHSILIVINWDSKTFNETFGIKHYIVCVVLWSTMKVGLNTFAWTKFRNFSKTKTMIEYKILNWVRFRIEPYTSIHLLWCIIYCLPAVCPENA